MTQPSTSKKARKPPNKSATACADCINGFIVNGKVQDAQTALTDMLRRYGNPLDNTLWSAKDKRTKDKVATLLFLTRANVQRVVKSQVVAAVAPAAVAPAATPEDRLRRDAVDRAAQRLALRGARLAGDFARQAATRYGGPDEAPPTDLVKDPKANVQHAADENADAQPQSTVDSQDDNLAKDPKANVQHAADENADAQPRSTVDSQDDATVKEGGASANTTSMHHTVTAAQTAPEPYTPKAGDYERDKCKWSQPHNGFMMNDDGPYAKTAPQNLAFGWIWKRDIGQLKERGAIRSHALTSFHIEGRQPPTASAAAGDKLMAPLFGNLYPDIPVTDWSITVVVVKGDIEKSWLEGFEVFGKEYCVSFCASSERGDTKKHMHIQATAKIRARAGQAGMIKAYMTEFFDGFQAMKNTKVQVKPYEATHKYSCMIGYVLKNQNNPTKFDGFVKSDDITPDVIAAAKRDYNTCNSQTYTGKVLLTPRTLLKHAASFYGCHFGTLPGKALDLLRCIELMLESEEYIADPSTVGYVASDFRQAEAQWDFAMNRKALTQAAVFQMFFKPLTREARDGRKTDVDSFINRGRATDDFSGRSFTWLQQFARGESLRQNDEGAEAAARDLDAALQADYAEETEFISRQYRSGYRSTVTNDAGAVCIAPEPHAAVDQDPFRTNADANRPASYETNERAAWFA
ncbi:hypothetical protein M885DRAFT_579303 [Pelagophyceae sp. CCMP2097]|nr:hypothetical protein M885DRAFT_579303 [Pelagophyceae sp. CCMP2097]